MRRFDVPTAGRLRRLALVAAAAVVLTFAVAALLSRYEALRDHGGLPGPLPVAVAVLANVVGNGVLVVAWRELVIATGVRLGAATAAWVWAASQLSRYMIGAAQVGGRALLARRHGLSGLTGGASVLVEVAWQLSVVAALALATLPWWLPGAGELTWLAWVGLPPVLVLAVGLADPQLLLRGLARVARARGVARLLGGRLDDLPERIRLGRREAAVLTALHVLNIVLRLAAYLALFAAVGGDLPEQLLLAVGANAAGQVVGRLAIFAPGGLGPREGVNALVLAPALGAAPALVLVAAVRLLEIVAELVFVALAGLAYRRRTTPAQGEG